MFHTKVCTTAFFDHKVPRRFSGIHHLFLQEKKMTPCHTCHHTAVKTHCKNVLLHFKDLVFHCFLHIVPYSLGAIYLSYSSYTCSHIAHPLHLASLLLICHELNFRLWKNSNWIFQDKSNVKIQHIHRMAEAGKHLWKSSASLLRMCSVSLLMVMLKQHWTQNQPLGHSTSDWCPA